MNYALISSGQVHAAAGLAEAVADRYGCVGVVSQMAVGTAALLEQTAQELSSRRIRCVRVQGRASGGLASRDLIAQIVGRSNADALADADLRSGFVALTEPGEGFRRVALLVAEAHSLLPSAVRYIQLARQANPAKLCVVLAGKPGLLAALEGDDFVPLRSAMHMMELSDPAAPGLFDTASAMPEPPAARRRGSSPLARLGLAVAIVPIVGLIWWRHLPATPEPEASSQDAPSVQVGSSAPSVPAAAGAAGAPSVVSPPAAAAPDAAEPAPAEPGPAAAPPQAVAGLPAEPAPAAPAATPEPPASEPPAKPDAPAESSVVATEPPVPTEPPAAPEPPAAEPSSAAELPAAAAEPSAAADAPAAPPERSEAPAQASDLAGTPAPEASPSRPDPVAAAKPPAMPRGTVTVTAAAPAHGGAKRAALPAAAPPPAALPARAPESRPSLEDERRCREIVFRAQLGKEPSDADKQFLRNGCHGG